MTTDTTGQPRLTDAEIAEWRDTHTRAKLRGDSSTNEYCAFCGYLIAYPCQHIRALDELIAIRAELAEMRSGEDDARLAAIAASIRPDTLVSLHPDDAMWLVRRARVAAATSSTEQERT